MKIEDIHKHLGKRVILNIPPTADRVSGDLYTIEGRSYQIPPRGVDLKLFGGLDLDGNVIVQDSFHNTYFMYHKYIEIPQSKYILDVYVSPYLINCDQPRWAIRDRVTGTTIGTYANEELANKCLEILNGTT